MSRRTRRSLYCVSEQLEVRRLLATITVTTTADDLTPSDGSVSLREAMTAINAGNDLGDPNITSQNPTATDAFGTNDTIRFSISGSGVHTIMPQSALPGIANKPMKIDGTSQPGFAGMPLIELDGENAGAGTDGFDIGAGNSTVRGLIINRFDGDGIALFHEDENLVAGCFIGTNSTGTATLANNGWGVEIKSIDNVVGGNTPADRNIISGNGKDGLVAVDGTRVIGNYIGTDVTGTIALPNAQNGVLVNFGDGNTIGGVDPGDGNLISGNTLNGIKVTKSATGTSVLGNFIGTDVSGGNALPNVKDGVFDDGAGSFTIGGTAPGSRNLVSGNGGVGIDIQAPNATVQGNFVGTDITGTSAISNGSDGVLFESEDGLVGGTAPGAGNLISGNKGDGLQVGFEIVGAVVQGNYIGTDVTGAKPLGNLGDGVVIQESDEIAIGGSIPEAANIIAFNGKNGVQAQNGVGTALIRLNSIYSNGNLGISFGFGLHGPTPNDLGDPDTSLVVDNNGQNFPVLASAVSNASGTTIQGLLNSNSNKPYLIDFYSNDAFDPTGYGEGQTYLGSIAVTTDFSGNATFNLNVPVASLGGKYLSATATLVSQSGDGETSEFSQDIQIAPKDKPLAIGSVFPVSAVEGTGFTGTLVRFTDGDSEAVAGDYSATIDWGDGTTSAGTISVASSGGFDVKGSHTFADEGSDTIKVTINDMAGRNDAGGESLVATTSAAVADAPLHASGKTLSGAEGRLLSATVASFTDDNLSAPIVDFTATINWGDGHTTIGTIISDGAGKYQVTGSHAYAEAKSSYNVKTTINDLGGSTASASSTAKIAESPLDQGIGKSLQVNVNSSFTNLTLAAFRDQDSLNTKASDYSGTINWGDGKTSSVKFVFNGSTFDVGSFWKVEGSHKYTSKKTYTVKITLFDTANSSAKLNLTSTIKVV